MLKYLCRAIHLTKDHYHFIIYKFLEFSQVAHHLHFQFSSYLKQRWHNCTNLWMVPLDFQLLTIPSPSPIINLPPALNNEDSRSLTSFDVIFSKSFCIIISLNLVLISLSVRSRSVGLRREKWWFFLGRILTKLMNVSFDYVSKLSGLSFCYS